MQNIKSICLVFILTTVQLFLSNGMIEASYKPLDSTQISEMVHSSSRNIISLQGTWEISSDDKNWERVYVPFTDYDESKIFYRKEINIDSQFAKNNNLKLFFLGLAGQVEIFFNGDFVTIIDGKFLPIDITIPKKIVYAGKNEIKLIFQQNSSNDIKHNLSVMNAPKFAKGIIREPFLIGTSQIYISELKCKLTNNLSNLNAEVIVTAGQISEQMLELEKDEVTGAIINKKVKLVAEYRVINKRTNETVVPIERKEFYIENMRTANFKLNLSINHLNKWMTYAPEMYKLDVKLKHNDVVIDDYFVNFGKNTIKIEKDLFYENDKPIEIKAFTYNEHFGSIEKTLSIYRMEEDIKIIKSIGANAIRVQHNFPHPYFIFLCEKYGMLLMLDLPLANTNRGLLSNQEFVIQHKNFVTRVFQNYSNSTAFFALGVGASPIESKEFTQFANKLIALTKKYNKLIYKIVELGVDLENINTSGYNFLCFQTNDANSKPEKITEELINIKRKYSFPILLAFSARVKPGNLHGYSDPTSIEHQAYFYKNCYNLVIKTELAGCLINSFNDYITQYPVLTLQYQNQHIITNGIYDIYRNDRQATSIIKAVFNDERIPLLNVGSYVNDIPIIYVISGFILLLILFFMINRYTRFREYFIRAFLRPYNFFADIREQRIMSIVQTLILGIIIAASIAICIGSVIFNIRNDINYGYLVTALFPFEIVLEIVFRSAWRPDLLLVVFTLFFLALLYICSLLLRLLAKILRAKLFIDNTITIIVWSALPFVLLLPVGIILAKLIIISQFFMYAFFALLIFIFLWFILRVFKAVAIIFDKTFLQVYSFGFLFLVLVLFIPILYYESNLGLLPFIEYFLFLP